MIPSAIDSRKPILSADHGSTRDTNTRTFRGPPLRLEAAMSSADVRSSLALAAKSLSLSKPAAAAPPTPAATPPELPVAGFVGEAEYGVVVGCVFGTGGWPTTGVNTPPARDTGAWPDTGCWPETGVSDR